MARAIKVEQSSGNVYADLGITNPQEYYAKAQIAYRICAIIKQRKLTQRKAAKILKIDQPKISALMNGILDGFSSDRLFRFLNSLDQDIEIVIKPRTRLDKPAEIRVLAA
jgi:predicted XRE-type DNA-binding protein